MDDLVTDYILSFLISTALSPWFIMKFYFFLYEFTSNFSIELIFLSTFYPFYLL